MVFREMLTVDSTTPALFLSETHLMCSGLFWLIGSDAVINLPAGVVSRIGSLVGSSDIQLRDTELPLELM